MADPSVIDVYNVFLAYVIRAAAGPPVDKLAFRRLTEAQGPLGGITATCFLLYRGSSAQAACVHRLLFDTAPILLQQLSRVTQPRRVELQGRTRGRVDWPGTFKARYSQDSSPAL